MSDNFLEKMLLLETLERIFRLRDFIDKASAKGLKHDYKIIEIYQSAIKEILRKLEVLFSKLSDDYGALELEERFSCMRRLADIFNSVDCLHSQLCFVYGEWTVPETYIFVETLFKSIFKGAKDNVSIVLSDTYMFEEIDLSKYIEFELKQRNMRVDLKDRTPTLFLPKIEYTNPLNWSILVHEVGHTLYNEYNDSNPILDNINKLATEADGIKILERWTEEVWCDLISVKLLGPSYLASYIAFSLLLASYGNIEESSKTHPSDRFRLSIMKNYMETIGMQDMNFTPKIGDTKGFCDFFEELFEQRCKFERDHVLRALPPPSNFPIDYQRFRDSLVEKIETLTHEALPVLKLDNEKVKQLKEKLEHGILIGSSTITANRKQLMTNLEEIDKIKESKKQPFNVKDKIDVTIKEAFEAIIETPCSIGEIVNAGWLYKCEVFYPKMIDLFFSKKGKRKEEELYENYEQFFDELTSLDDNLRKSIEISYIHNIFDPRKQK